MLVWYFLCFAKLNNADLFLQAMTKLNNTYLFLQVITLEVVVHNMNWLYNLELVNLLQFNF